jgi:hypothetical protein
MSPIPAQVPAVARRFAAVQGFKVQKFNGIRIGRNLGDR